MADLNELQEAVIRGDLANAKGLTQEFLDEGFPVDQLLDDALIAAMKIVGERFTNNEFFVPEMLIAARAMNGAMELLEPKLVEAGVEPAGKVVLGTVKGDLHDIGKNLVGMMLKGAGFNVIDLRVDCPPEKFVEAAEENGAQIIAMSALLTTTMVCMKDVLAAVQASSCAGRVKTLIGGAPVTQAYCDEIGADAFAPDAPSAVNAAKELVGAI